MTTSYTLVDTTTGETRSLRLLSQVEIDVLFKSWLEDEADAQEREKTLDAEYEEFVGSLDYTF